MVNSEWLSNACGPEGLVRASNDEKESTLLDATSLS